MAVTAIEVPVNPYGTPLPDQVEVMLVVFDDHFPGSQVMVEPVRAVPIIFGSTVEVGSERFCLTSFTYN